MTAARQAPTAALLPSGMVLITGGYNGSYLKTAELYNPANGTFTATGSVASPRSAHTAALLDAGTVLVAGGEGTATPTSMARSTSTPPPARSPRSAT